MIWHISIFYVKKEENIVENVQKLSNELIQMEQQVEGAIFYYAGTNKTKLPVSIPGMPVFGDCAQIICFPSEKEADLYPESEAHKKLQKRVGGIIERVAASDIRIEA